MDQRRFDRLSRDIATAGTRRSVVRSLVTILFGGAFVSEFDEASLTLAFEDDHGSSHRRRRRRTRHKHDRNTGRRNKPNKPNKRKKPKEPNLPPPSPPPPPPPRCAAGADICQDAGASCAGGTCFCQPRLDGTGSACTGAVPVNPAVCNCANDAACASFGADWICVRVTDTSSALASLLPSLCGGPVTSLCSPPCAGGA